MYLHNVARHVQSRLQASAAENMMAVLYAFEKWEAMRSEHPAEECVKWRLF